jgi:hypothetical protein
MTTIDCDRYDERHATNFFVSNDRIAISCSIPIPGQRVTAAGVGSPLNSVAYRVPDGH